MRKCNAVALVVGCTVLFMLVVTTSVMAAAPNFSLRPGTIRHALLQPDGTHIYLDAETVCKIRFRQNPNYFAIKEFFSGRDSLVVFGPAPAELRYGQTIDVEGTITTLWNGERAIVDPVICGYLDRDGNLLYHGPLLKGLYEPTPWNWKRVLSSPSVSGSSASSSVSILSEEDPQSGEPNTLLSGSAYCATIAEARTLYSSTERVLVELQCRPLENPISGHFTLKEDGSSDSIAVYYTEPVQATDRINKIVGAIQKDAGSNYWIEIDSGPSWLPQDVKGSVQTAASGTIAWLKTLPDETLLESTQEDKVVSRVFPSEGYLYIQERQDEAPKTPTGIRVYYSGDVGPGDVVSVEPDSWSTRIITVDGERAIADPWSVSATTSVTAPGPVAVNHRVLGGGSFNVFTPGPVGGAGVNNVGLLVRAFGAVTYVDSGYFYVDDGARITDGGIPTGVRVVGLNGYQPYTPAEGDYVVVTGITGLATFNAGYGLARTIRVAGSSDLGVAKYVGPPTGVEVQPTGTDQGANGKLTIYWKATPGATGYNIYRGTTSSGENYQSPTNGATPWNTPSYPGSNTYAYTDTGLTFGQEYFYTVKAVRDGQESVPSLEDSDIPDSWAIPWDSGNAYAITSATANLYGYYADLICAVGPDDTVYSNWEGVLRPGGSVDLGTLEPGTNVLHYSDGSTLIIPDDGGILSGEDEGESDMGILSATPTTTLNASDGPYRRVRSASTCTGAHGVFFPGWANQIYMSPQYPKDTYWTYLGSRTIVGTGRQQTTLEVDAGLQWSRVHHRYNPHLSLKYKRYDGTKARTIAPKNWPIDYDTSYFGGIEMYYAFQRSGRSSVPTILFHGQIRIGKRQRFCLPLLAL